MVGIAVRLLTSIACVRFVRVTDWPRPHIPSESAIIGDARVVLTSPSIPAKIQSVLKQCGDAMHLCVLDRLAEQLKRVVAECERAVHSEADFRHRNREIAIVGRIACDLLSEHGQTVDADEMRTCLGDVEHCADDLIGIDTWLYPESGPRRIVELDRADAALITFASYLLRKIDLTSGGGHCDHDVIANGPPGLTEEEASVIEFLVGAGRKLTSIDEIVDHIDPTQSHGTVCACAKRLEKYGYVDRPSGRRKGLSLTPAGREVAADLTQLVH